MYLFLFFFGLARFDFGLGLVPAVRVASLALPLPGPSTELRSLPNRLVKDPEFGKHGITHLARLFFSSVVRTGTNNCTSCPPPSAAVEAVTSLLCFFFPGGVHSSASVSDRATIFRFFFTRSFCFFVVAEIAIAAGSLSESPSRSCSSVAILFLALTLRTRVSNEERCLKIALSPGV